MAHAYTPGLLVTPRKQHRVRRMLPIPGDVLVEQGALVAAQDVVARTFMPGDITPINLSNKLSLPPSDVASVLLKKEGAAVAIGEPLARTKGMFGFFQSEFASPAAGTLESVSSVTGQVMIRGEPLPVQVLAYLAGRVIEVLPQEGVVIEADVALVQGIFGVGGEAYGLIRCVGSSATDDVTAERIPADGRGAVIVGGGRVHESAIRQAVSVGASAVVAGGIDDQDLKALLGYDLGVAITGSESIGITVIITEGFGDISMADATFAMLRQHEGSAAAVNGATQIRAGVLRPEIVVPLPPEAGAVTPGAASGGGLLSEGCRVRMIRDPYFGFRGTVVDLPHEPQLLETGSRARVVEIECDDGSRIKVPRANVEIAGG